MSETLRSHWALDPAVIHLNHGSFGACPRRVLAIQSALRDELEWQPGAFFSSIGERLGAARQVLGAFVGADPDGLAFTTNVTAALNSAIGSIDLAPGDEILVTDHEYNATRNIALRTAERAGAKLVVARLPFVGFDDARALQGVMDSVSDRTRVAVIDHVTSQTALVLPLAQIISLLEAKGVEVIVDGAHAPGMLNLDIEALAPAWYTGNCHKWLCAPKSVGFLWARADKRAITRSAIVSHGASIEEPMARFRAEFDWPGTVDPTAALAVPGAIDFVDELLGGGGGGGGDGWDQARMRNHALCVAGRRILCDTLEITPPCADDAIGSMATLPLPDRKARGGVVPKSALDRDPLRRELLERHGIEVPTFQCSAHDGKLIRVSAALYNEIEDFELLATALRQILFA